jgi:hypothetical protein
MTGNDLVDLLLVPLNCQNDAKLSERLGIPTVHNWRQQKTLTKTVVRNTLKKVISTVIRSSFDSIVEFHPLTLSHGHHMDTLSKRIGSKSIVDRLSKENGIYLFYDSSGKVIYCGRALKAGLWTEMNQAYGLYRSQYKGNFANANGIFSNRTLSIKKTAMYFSAYRVDDVLVSKLEAFVTRIVPNDLINKKTERLKPGR